MKEVTLLAGGVIGALIWQVMEPDGCRKAGEWFLRAVAVEE